MKAILSTTLLVVRPVGRVVGMTLNLWCACIATAVIPKFAHTLARQRRAGYIFIRIETKIPYKEH